MPFGVKKKKKNDYVVLTVVAITILYEKFSRFFFLNIFPRGFRVTPTLDPCCPRVACRPGWEPTGAFGPRRFEKSENPKNRTFIAIAIAYVLFFFFSNTERTRRRTRPRQRYYFLGYYFSKIAAVFTTRRVLRVQYIKRPGLPPSARYYAPGPPPGPPRRGGIIADRFQQAHTRVRIRNKIR